MIQFAKFFILVILFLSSLMIIVPMLEDGSNTIPSWLSPYTWYIFFIWLVIFIFAAVAAIR